MPPRKIALRIRMMGWTSTASSGLEKNCGFATIAREDAGTIVVNLFSAQFGVSRTTETSKYWTQNKMNCCACSLPLTNGWTEDVMMSVARTASEPGGTPVTTGSDTLVDRTPPARRMKQQHHSDTSRDAVQFLLFNKSLGAITYHVSSDT
jgi:hypothetical protein